GHGRLRRVVRWGWNGRHGLRLRRGMYPLCLSGYPGSRRWRRLGLVIARGLMVGRQIFRDHAALLVLPGARLQLGTALNALQYLLSHTFRVADGPELHRTVLRRRLNDHIAVVQKLCPDAADLAGHVLNLLQSGLLAVFVQPQGAALDLHDRLAIQDIRVVVPIGVFPVQPEGVEQEPQQTEHNKRHTWNGLQERHPPRQPYHDQRSQCQVEQPGPPQVADQDEPVLAVNDTLSTDGAPARKQQAEHVHRWRRRDVELRRRSLGSAGRCGQQSVDLRADRVSVFDVLRSFVLL